MLPTHGQKKVIITNVAPQIDCGKYPAKAIIQEALLISADVFSDGHDEITATVLIKHKKDRQWKECPLNFINNDRWEYQFYPENTGFYQFQIQGWIDHFATWKKDFIKKYEAGLDVKVELQIGALLIEGAAVNRDITSSKTKTKEKARLLEFSVKLASEENIEKALSIATNDELADIMHRSRDKNLISNSSVFEFEVETKRASFSTWYELFPRSASSEPGMHGTFKDVKKILPRIAEMGFDILYFPPIHPIGEAKRKGKNNSLAASPEDPGSPWAIGNKLGGHKSIHPELGTLKDFKDLIREAKKYGIEIAMDIAYQCAPDHPYIKEHPQWFKWRPDGTVQYAENPPKKYEDILPFNFETEDWQKLWEELKSIIEYWIDKGISVFRIDNPHTKAFAFWEWMIPEVRKNHPDTIFLAEAFSRERIVERLAKAGFNQSYTYFTWRNTKSEIEDYMRQLTKTDMRYYFRPNFWPNTPDILPPELTYGGENAHIRRLILAATLSSNYGLYGPVYEFGFTEPMPGKEEYVHNEKYEIKNWDWNAQTRIREIITRVNKIRKENLALQSTYNIEFAETTNEQILCYIKTDKRTNNVLIIVVNMDSWNAHSAHVKIPIEKLGFAKGQYLVHDLLSGDKYRWLDEWNYVHLDPHAMPAHIFKVETI